MLGTFANIFSFIVLNNHVMQHSYTKFIFKTISRYSGIINEILHIQNPVRSSWDLPLFKELPKRIASFCICLSYFFKIVPLRGLKYTKLDLNIYVSPFLVFDEMQLMTEYLGEDIFEYKNLWIFKVNPVFRAFE